jgi:S-methylmethionine-dependent homocysteine/selenocysteine methylase
MTNLPSKKPSHGGKEQLYGGGPKQVGGVGPKSGRRDRAVLLDGGTGSELRRRGIALRADVWSAEANIMHSESLTAIHRDFIEAGADVITANTFAASRYVLEAANLGDRYLEINSAAVKAAILAANSVVDRHTSELPSPTQHSKGKVAVAASLSCFPPNLDATAYPNPDAELAAYRESVDLFAEQGVDLILLEMMQETVHASLACQAAAESQLPFWLGLSCRRDRSNKRLVGFDAPNNTLEDILDELLSFEPAAVNIMHTPIAYLEEALSLVRARWSGRIGVYPEIPYPQDPDAEARALAGEDTRTTSAATYAQHVRRWLSFGADIVGGCCGTTPEHIRAVRAEIDSAPG